MKLVRSMLTIATVGAYSLIAASYAPTSRTRSSSSKLEEIGLVFTAAGISLLATAAFTSVEGAAGAGRGAAIDLMALQWMWSIAATDVTMSAAMVVGDLLSLSTSDIVVGSGPISMIGSAADVIHAFTLTLGNVKADVLPGRLSLIHLAPTEHGLYAGQCSELCGALHGAMALCREKRPILTSPLGRVFACENP